MNRRRKNFAEKALNSENVGLDAFRNAPARMGYATPSLAEAAEYELVRWSNNYWLMITMFRNHWLSRRIVEAPAQDMCKAWPRLKCDLSPDDIKQFDRVIRRTFTGQRIEGAITWARLFGGGAALIVIKGHENILDKPLDLDDIAPGSYKGLIVFDRWSGIQPGTEISTDLDAPVDYGFPEYYNVTGEEGQTFRVHRSRILRFSGPIVPQPEYQAQMRWGISNLEPVYEELRKKDNASWSILQLMFRAQILTQVNNDLASMLSGVGSSQQALAKFMDRMSTQNELISNNSMLILPKDGKLESHSYSFAGIPEVYQQFQLDIAGAAEMPVTRLFGRTITGLGQSNDADERLYEEKIAQKQNTELRPNLDKLYPIIMMSEFGQIPDDYDLEFPSIRVLTEEDKSKLAKDGAEAVLAPFNAGVNGYGSKKVLMELRAIGDKTEIFTNITDEDIEAAPNDDSAIGGEGGSEFRDVSAKGKEQSEAD